ncbi:T9SS type A sorting domain-containing protein [Seonamhaeicola sediminis]|uniref:T9SS type A sorting domain-containing protein n=1 Tax=Seonamhaeicola sediminis TaxID=2528206 RepID=A0A562YHS3_9FLAO|nr:T9SS type A sorting domain-containing protein [Seonamhaeicola sediminis]TWO34583.1 T9SS type A sorting domain-containing protein [Seonamhaeicola sediminis]
MKKITFILFLFSATFTFAQFSGAGEYYLLNNFTTNGVVYLSHDGAKAVRATANSAEATKFDFVSTGVADQYNIVVNTDDGILRANSTSEIPVVSYSGTPSTSNPNVWTVTVTASTGPNGEPTYNVWTPNTSSGRFLVYNNSTDAIGYSGSNFTRTQWIFTSTNPLSNKEFNQSSIFVSNPINNAIEISGLTSNINKVEVYNLVGKSLIVRDTKGLSSLNLDATALSSGVYVVKFIGTNTFATRKIVKR